MGAEVPADWYRNSSSPNSESLYWDEEGGEEKVALSLEMLKLDGYERILELACATGCRTLELSRRGFEVIGVENQQELLEGAACEADMEDLWPYFVEEDPRYLEFEREFDLVLSLGGGAFEHFDYDEENLCAFEVAARALRPGGRLLMQAPPRTSRRSPSSGASTRSRNWRRSSTRSASALATSSTNTAPPACRLTPNRRSR